MVSARYGASDPVRPAGRAAGAMALAQVTSAGFRLHSADDGEGHYVAVLERPGLRVGSITGLWVMESPFLFVIRKFM